MMGFLQSCSLTVLLIIIFIAASTDGDPTSKSLLAASFGIFAGFFILFGLMKSMNDYSGGEKK